jgi:glycosyltransferase involved in cell wall biosynthesis
MSALSVLMTNYNYGKYLAEALEGVLNQSFVPLEVIVVDDASADDSVKIIREFMRSYPNLKLLQNEKNMGTLYSINLALENASGEYVYSAASDDKVLPEFFVKSMDLLCKYPQAGLSCSDILILQDNKYIENKYYLSNSPAYFSPDEVVHLMVREPISIITPHGVIIKRSLLLKAGGYQEVLKWTCDSFAHHVIAFRYGICYIPEALVMTRKHGLQYGGYMTKSSLSEREVISNSINMVRKPEYKDVLPMFQKTAPFSLYPWEVLSVVMRNRSNWNFLSLKLIRFALFDKFVRRLLLRLFPMSFCRKMVNSARNIRSSMKKAFVKRN